MPTYTLQYDIATVRYRQIVQDPLCIIDTNINEQKTD